MAWLQYSGILFICLLVLGTSTVGSQYIGSISPGFEVSPQEWKQNYFLLSINSVFGLGFHSFRNLKLLLLIVTHISSGRGVCTANRSFLVDNSAKFLFGINGNVSLKMGNVVVWSPKTFGKKVASIELWDTGNLVLLGKNGSIIWQSFSYPSDTLLPGQKFLEGMRLQSRPSRDNLTVFLEFKSGDLVLYAGYQTPQTYWSLSNDSRKTNSSVSGKVHSATLEANAWNFYDWNDKLLWQFPISENAHENTTWSLVLGSDGRITFPLLQNKDAFTVKTVVIPPNSCDTPEPCRPYHFCELDNWCECPKSLDSQFNCKPPIASTCKSSSHDSVELFYVGPSLDYFGLKFVTPSSRYDFDACKQACLQNCSCSVLFFENSTQSCFLFDQIGSLLHSQQNSNGFVSYIKISKGRNDERRKREKKVLTIVLVVLAGIVVICFLFNIPWCRRKIRSRKSSKGNLEMVDLLDNDYFSGMPARFRYLFLCEATKSFSTRIGRGGFGSVYLGSLPDGTQVAVKRLEATEQGQKEFRAEVSTIGKVHHLHLVKLRGYCDEEGHKLLVYEYMENGSLNKWIFNTNEGSQLLSWDTRFNIALGTARGLAYLHSECEEKVVHCDIKPENILLDENFSAKVSDFGLAKLMTHEQSRAFTTLRGTRGYLAPEWIKKQPISEKTDVYSYGLVLLEIIGGRRISDVGDDSEKALPSYAFKMFEEANIREIIDPKLEINENYDRFLTAIKVALWCIQENMHLRPSMTEVIQMLEGSRAVSQPPTLSQMSSQEYLNWRSTSMRLYGDSDGGLLSDVQLSGPR